MQEHHPTFHKHQVVVDFNLLNQLPEDGLVHDRICSVENQALEDAFQDIGPPEENNNEQPPNPLYSAGFVPNIHGRISEEDQLHQAALNSDDPVILTMPSLCGTPINERSG